MQLQEFMYAGYSLIISDPHVVDKSEVVVVRVQREVSCLSIDQQDVPHLGDINCCTSQESLADAILAIEQPLEVSGLLLIGLDLECRSTLRCYSGISRLCCYL